MKNRKLLLIVSIVLALTMSLGGTLAYLTDTDSDVNTMVLGNVSIVQHEYQRADADKDGEYDTIEVDKDGTKVTSYKLEAFEQDKPLLPVIYDPGTSTDPKYGYENTRVYMTQVDSYGNMQVFATPNAVDKFVTVENDGNTDAYVRTYVAFENGNGNASLIGFSSRGDKAENAATGLSPWISTYLGKYEINGNTYSVYEYVYNGAKLSDNTWRHEKGILPKGETTYPSLCQVYLKSAATNEDLIALDGNCNGKLDILVLSQAVQEDGFTSADQALTAGFGAPTATSEEDDNKTNVQVWLEAASTELPTVVSDLDGLKAAAADGADNLVLNAGGKNLGSLNYGLTKNMVPEGSTLSVANATFEGTSYGNAVDGTVVFENCTFTNTGAYSIHFDAGNGNVIFNNCVLEGWCSFGSTIQSVEMNNCTIKGNGVYALCRFYQTTTLNNCTIDCSNAPAADKWVDGISAVNGATVTLNGCNLKYLDYEVAQNAKIVVDGVTVAESSNNSESVIKNAER